MYILEYSRYIYHFLEYSWKFWNNQWVFKYLKILLEALNGERGDHTLNPEPPVPSWNFQQHQLTPLAQQADSGVDSSVVVSAGFIDIIFINCVNNFSVVVQLPLLQISKCLNNYSQHLIVNKNDRQRNEYR